MSQTQSPLGAFDPFAMHPFTNTNGLMPRPPPPSKYPRGVHSGYAHAPQTPATPSYGNSPPPMPFGAPLPVPFASPMTPAPSPGRSGIFYTFTPDRRGTPELEDILAKKRRPQVWGTK
jgi:hypothetical protein